MSNLPRWEDVKDHPEDRMLYHKVNHDELLADLETLTRQMLKDAETEQQKMVVRLVRLVADGMVKCFEQMYYDVQQGCPGWKPAQWVRANGSYTELSIAELGIIGEALSYARSQVTDSYIPIFGGINGDSGESYTSDEVVQAQENIDGILNAIEVIISNDEGMIVVNG